MGQRLIEGLDTRIGALSVNGDLDSRLPGNLNVSFPGIDGADLLLGLCDIALSSGAACSSKEETTYHVLRAIGLSDDLARASLGLGRLQLTLVGFGEEEELLPAFEQLRRALGLFRKLNDRQGRAECLMGLTQIYLHGDNERQEADMRQAFDCLAEALAIYRLLGDDEAVAFAQRMMDNFDRAGDRVE